MEAVVLAGGEGTRLRPVTGDSVPKPMADLLGRPLLEWQLAQLAASGFDAVHLVVGYRHEVIRDYFGDGRGLGLSIDYVVEDEPLGTAGGLYYLRGRIGGPFALVFGDLFFDVEWDRFLSFHRTTGAAASLLVHPNSHPADSDVVLLGGDQRITGVLPKNVERAGWFKNLVNAGLYVMSPGVLELIDAPVKTDLERDVLPRLIAGGEAFGYRSPEYVKDAGTPDRFAAVAEDVGNGVPSRRNLKRRQRAVFLDRDGTINVLKGFLKRPEDFELEAGAAEAVGILNSAGYLCVVVTNQPVIARGECSFETVEEIHSKMETLLGAEGAYLDAVLYCPHHPDGGFEGEVPELKCACSCRKPATGMLDSAVEAFNIDPRSSWTVGDTTVDVQTGRNAGTRTALVATGEAGGDGKYSARPDMTFGSILDFAEYISGERA